MNLRRRRPVVLMCLLAAGLALAPALPAAAAGPPALTAVTPQPAGAGTTVTLTGSGLTGVTAIDFTGAPAAPYAVVDDTSVTATVPTGAVDGPVTVHTADGTASLGFDVAEPARPGPSAVTGLTLRAGDRTLALQWALPPDAAAVVVRRAQGTAAPATPQDGTEVARGAITQHVDAGLANGAVYSYAIWTVDAAGTTGAVATITGSPASPVPGVLRIGLSAATVTHGTYVHVTGVLTQSGGPVAGAGVVLLARPRGGVYAGVARAFTDAVGVVRFSYRAAGHAELALRRAGDTFNAEVLTAPVPLTVRHGLAARISSGVVLLGSATTIYGRVAPGTPGLRVRLQRQVAGVWATSAETALDATGAYRFVVRPASTGEQLLRVATLGDARHLPAVGPVWRVVTLARTLRQGHSGSDVLAVERRLTDLRYDVGPMSGVFDYDTRLAVMAFQKVHGLPRTGVVDGLTRVRLGNPTTPRLRHPVVGLSVEIDLTKQVLYFARNGSVQRILPVSSGNNELYTVDGVTSRAVTPVGSYRITRKIDGVRVSRLGELFQPAYFYGGFAIHGSPSVPAYPASHGCVRVTKPAMSRLFPLLPVGTPVRLYYS